MWLFRLPSSSSVSCLRFDLHTLLVGVERDLRVYSLADGSVLGQISRAHSAALTSVDVSTEAGLVVSASRDCTLRWFALDSFHCRRHSARRGGHVETVTSVRLLPTAGGRRVASISLDGALKVGRDKSSAPPHPPACICRLAHGLSPSSSPAAACE